MGVWKGICVQEWRESHHGILSRVCCAPRGETRVRNCRQRSLWQPKPKTFIRKEEKCTILENRTAEGASKIVLPLLRFRDCWCSRRIEPVVCVKDVIPEIVEQCSVELICTGAG